MKKIYTLTIFLFLPVSISGCKPAETEVKPDYSTCKACGYTYNLSDINDYELVWSDEFDVDGSVDDTKWSFDLGGSGWGNQEKQYYTDGRNAKVENGLLIIEARKEVYQGMDYTSSRIVSKNKGDWLYGKIEVMAKLPRGTGTWPAIWMLPTEWKYGDWPKSGEIDIMEHVGYDQNKIHGTVHTELLNHLLNTQVGNQKIIEDASDAFHVYGIEWLPDQIRFSIDGEVYFIFKPKNQVPRPTVGRWPFDQKFHLIMNIAVGGSWGGARGIDDSIFPQTLEVDYVRVYQSEMVSQLKKG